MRILRQVETRGALGYLGRCIRSLSKLKSTPKALISGQKAPFFQYIVLWGTGICIHIIIRFLVKLVAMKIK